MLGPENLSLNLRGNGFAHEGLMAMAATIEHPNCPPGLQLDLGCHYIERDGTTCTSSKTGETQIAAAVKVNTTILKCILSADNNIQGQINCYIHRNQLIRKYPEFSSHILSVCYQYDLYQPPDSLHKTPLKLSLLCANTLWRQQSIASTTLPNDLCEFIDKVKQLNDDLTVLTKSQTEDTFSH